MMGPGLAKGRNKALFPKWKNKEARIKPAKGRIELHFAFRLPHFHKRNKALFRKSRQKPNKAGERRNIALFDLLPALFGNRQTTFTAWLLVDSHSLHPHTHPYHQQAPPKNVLTAKEISAIITARHYRAATAGRSRGKRHRGCCEE
jgi:hypothetical protein